MSVSMVGSSLSTQSIQRPQGPAKEIREGVDSLKKAVDSGDMTAAQSAYDSLSKLQSDKQGVGASSSAASSSSSGGKDPLSKLLTSVGEALKSGDVGAVQQAVAQNGPPVGGPGGAGGPPPGGAGAPPPGGGGGGPPGGEEVGSAIGGLAQSLQSGDVSGAQESFTALTKLLAASQEDEEEENETSPTGSAPATSPNAFLDKLKSSLTDIGSALQSGDMASAQKLFSSVATRGSQGVNVLA